MMEGPILYREDLDEKECRDCSEEGTHNPDTHELYMGAACHNTTKILARYNGDGTMTIMCSVCDKFVMNLAIASDPNKA